MARRRMIDPNIWTSEDVSKLLYLERLLLIGMFSNADDYGKGRANTTYLRSTIFPYDDIPILDIKKMVKNISNVVNITLYSLSTSEYYKFNNWTKWQRVDKPQPSLIPEPQRSSDSENDSENDSGLKEDKGKEDKGKEYNPPVDKSPVHVTIDGLKLTEEEYLKAVLKYGEKEVNNKLENMENYKGLGKRYKSLYKTLCNWLKGDCKPELPQEKPKSKYQ